LIKTPRNFPIQIGISSQPLVLSVAVSKQLAASCLTSVRPREGYANKFLLAERPASWCPSISSAVYWPQTRLPVNSSHDQLVTRDELTF